MRSELIFDIFSVETEAENILMEARKKSRETVSLAHTEGASLVKVALQEAREARQKKVSEAQKSSANKIASLQETFLLDSRDSQQDALLADRISDDMVAFLCSSPLVESRKQ